MDGRRVICWLRPASLFSPPRFVAPGSEDDPPSVRDKAESEALLQQDNAALLGELNAVMKGHGSGRCTFPASLLCCGFFCSTVRNQTALRQVALVLESKRRRPPLQLCFRSEDVPPQDQPDCWIEEYDGRGKQAGPMLYQLA